MSRFSLRILLLALIFGAISLYGIFALRNTLAGPHITLDTVLTRTKEKTILLRGTAERASTLSVNGLPVVMTPANGFADIAALADGDNVFVFEAIDRFGVHETTTVHIWHDANSDNSPLKDGSPESLKPTDSRGTIETTN